MLLLVEPIWQCCLDLGSTESKGVAGRAHRRQGCASAPALGAAIAPGEAARQEGKQQQQQQQYLRFR